MRRIVFVTVLVAGVVLSVIPASAAPRVQGATLVVFGEHVWYRHEAVIAGVEQALSALPGVTVLIPRSRPFSLHDAELAGIEGVAEIYLAEVISRDDRGVSISIGGASVNGTRTTIRVRLGLRFLRVTGNGHYLQFLGAGEAEGSAEGLTSASAYIPSFGSVGSSSVLNLEAAAFRNVALKILGR